MGRGSRILTTMENRFSRRQLLAGGLILAGGVGAATLGVAVVDAGSPMRSLTFIAHPDDDLLFINPAQQLDITAGRRLETVYLTSGDGGFGEAYARYREEGVMAAMAEMSGTANRWVARPLRVDGRVIDRRVLAGNTNLSALFLRLPDGGDQGRGYPSTGFVSLEKLWTGSRPSMTATDGSSDYAQSELVATLAGIIDQFGPTTVRTQDFVHRYGEGDHSDHYSVGYFVRAAAERRSHRAFELMGYLGYPSRRRPANVSGARLREKTRTFLVYARYDLLVPHSVEQLHLLGHGRWTSWMAREWRVA